MNCLSNSQFQVLNKLLDGGKLNNCRALDLSSTVNLNVEAVHRFISLFAGISYRLEAFSYTGHVSITEQFWINAIRYLHRIKYNEEFLSMKEKQIWLIFVEY